MILSDFRAREGPCVMRDSKAPSGEAGKPFARDCLAFFIIKTQE
jgi:hypothetical protein